MDTRMITVAATVYAPIEKVWKYWNEPEHITKWAFASDDWEASHAKNDLRKGGTFTTRMQAKDGSAGFDFTGTYTEVRPNECIAYVMDGADHRHVTVDFASIPEGTRITETFEPENENPLEMQRAGWQAILESFKKHVERS